MEQFSLLKIYEQFSKRKIEQHELFSAIDIDNNMSVSCDELIKFMKSLINGTSDVNSTKVILDKDIRFFMAYMDTDRNNFISKGEFLKQY
jgi:Ca2+-binding EF-hand superfamily protein